MQLSGERQLEGWYRENGLPPVFLLYGEDSYPIEKQRDRLQKLAVTQFEDFNLYKADGRTQVDMDELLDSALALPFMSETRCVVLDDLDLSAQDAAGLDKLFALLASPSPSTCMVITVRTNTLDLKKKSGKAYKLWDLCDKGGVVCDFPRPARADVARAASNQAVKLGCRMDSATAGLLADYCGGELLRTLSETRKLAAYKGGQGDIDSQTVALLVEPVVEARVFDLSARLLKKDLDGALAIVSDLLFLRESPVAILSILSMAFADLYRGACAKRAGIPNPQAQKELGYFGGSAYRYQKAVEGQSRLERQTLGQIVLLLAQADMTIKESGANQNLVLETTVTQVWMLCGQGVR